MQEENASAVFGLNWVQDMQPVEIAGAYDPEQEMWMTSGPVRAFDNTTTSVTTTSNMTIQETTHTTLSASGNDVAQDEGGDSLPDQQYDIDNGPDPFQN